MVSNPQGGPGRAEVLARLEALGRRQSTAMVLFHANVAARLGLGATDGKVLEIVARHGSLTPKQLVALTGLAPASITGVLDRLQRKGFVRRAASARDRRQVDVTYSPEHEQAVQALFADLLSAMAKVHERYSTAELALVAGFLEATTAAQEGAARRLGEQP